MLPRPPAGVVSSLLVVDQGGCGGHRRPGRLSRCPRKETHWPERRSIESSRASRSGPESRSWSKRTTAIRATTPVGPAEDRRAPDKLQVSLRLTALTAGGAPVASDRDDFGMRDRRAVVAGEQASMLRQRVAIEHGLHPLLPLATLVNERVTRPHPRAQIERCSGAIQHSGNLPAINSSRRCLASARSFFACCLFPRNALV